MQHYYNLLSEGGLFKPNSNFLSILEKLNSIFVNVNIDSLSLSQNFMKILLEKSKNLVEEKIAKRSFLGRTSFRIRFLNKHLKHTKLTNAKKK